MIACHRLRTSTKMEIVITRHQVHHHPPKRGASPTYNLLYHQVAGLPQGNLI